MEKYNNGTLESDTGIYIYNRTLYFLFTENKAVAHKS